jgi:RNA polymerase sigma-70 factor, ECF subfamily
MPSESTRTLPDPLTCLVETVAPAVDPEALGELVVFPPLPPPPVAAIAIAMPTASATAPTAPEMSNRFIGVKPPNLDGFAFHPRPTPGGGHSFPGLMPALRKLDPARAAEHLPRLYRAARAWTRSREEAEDLVQETYARVLARPRLLRNEDEVGYLLRALRNTLISQRRAESRRPATTELIDEVAIGTRGSDDPGEAAEIRQVYAAIAQLPDEFRDALVAVDVAGLSYGEAARALGVPEGTLTSRLFRARDRVARLLRP